MQQRKLKPSTPKCNISQKAQNCLFQSSKIDNNEGNQFNNYPTNKNEIKDFSKVMSPKTTQPQLYQVQQKQSENFQGIPQRNTNIFQRQQSAQLQNRQSIQQHQQNGLDVKIELLEKIKTLEKQLAQSNHKQDQMKHYIEGLSQQKKEIETKYYNLQSLSQRNRVRTSIEQNYFPDLEIQNNILEEQINTLICQQSELKEKYQKLKNDKQELLKENDILTFRQSELTKSKEELSEIISALTQEQSELQKKYESQDQKNNNQFITKNLTHEYANLLEKNNIQVKELNDLREKNQCLMEWKETKIEEIIKLDERIEELSRQNEILKMEQTKVYRSEEKNLDSLTLRGNSEEKLQKYNSKLQHNLLNQQSLQDIDNYLSVQDLEPNQEFLSQNSHIQNIYKEQLYNLLFTKWLNEEQNQKIIQYSLQYELPNLQSAYQNYFDKFSQLEDGKKEIRNKLLIQDWPYQFYQEQILILYMLINQWIESLQVLQIQIQIIEQNQQQEEQSHNLKQSQKLQNIIKALKKQQKAEREKLAEYQEKLKQNEGQLQQAGDQERYLKQRIEFYRNQIIVLQNRFHERQQQEIQESNQQAQC